MLHAAVSPSLPPTAATHTVSGRFSANLPADMKEVIVVRQSHLSLYRTTKSLSQISSSSADADESAVLSLVAETSLNAPPLSAGVCKPAAATAGFAWSHKSGGSGSSSSTDTDVLVLLFDDFHISFLQFNALRMDFDTIALVQLDDRDTRMERCPLQPILRVDPMGAYVAVLVQRRQLFVFPISRRVKRAEASALQDGAAAAAAAGSAGDGVEHAAAATAAGANKMPVKPEVKAKVALDAWGDDDDDKDDDEPERENDIHGTGEDNNNRNRETNKDEEGNGAVGSTPVPREQLHISVLNEEVLQMGVITKLFLTDIKPHLHNARDFQFVETAGGEPLLAILYEKDPTWAGRVKLVEWRSRTVESNMLTCSVLWVKWTLANTPNPKALPIGDVEHLPFNLTHMAPLPAFQQVPSAVLCVGQNTLVHVSIRDGYGAFTNANGKEEVQAVRSSAVVYEPMRWSSAAEEKSLDLVKTNLSFADCAVVVADDAYRATHGRGNGAQHSEAQAAWNEEAKEEAPLRLLLVTEKMGTVVGVTLRAGGYNVSAMESRILMTGCFANCWSSLGADRYFLGSFNGDSRVVHWTAGSDVSFLQTFVGLGPVQDADIVDCSSHASALAAGDNADSALDSSIEYSPFADLFHNVSVDPEPQTPVRARRQVMDLALCSGSGTAGSVCVLRQSIRNDVIRREEVNAVSVFFLENKRVLRGDHNNQSHRRKRQREEGGTGDANGSATATSTAATGRDSNAHLVMTGNRFTILFAIRSDSVQQVRGTVLNIGTRTVFAAEFDWAPALLQVTETELYVASLDGKRTINHVVLASALGSAAAAEAHGHVKAAFLLTSQQAVAVHFERGQVVLFEHLVEADGTVAPSGTVAAEGVNRNEEVHCTVVPLLQEVKAIVQWQSQNSLVAIQKDDLVVYDVDQSRIAATFPNFAVLPPIAVEGMPTPIAKLSERLNRTPFPNVTHLNVFDHPSGDTLSSSSSSSSPARGIATLSLITSSGELLTYRVLPRNSYGPQRLVKAVHHLLDIRPEREKMETIEEKKRRLAEEQASLEKDTLSMRDSSERLVPFSDIGGYEGVYACGQNPVFLLYDEERGELVATRHQTDGAVRGFSRFRSRLVEGGYVYCCEGYVHFASMQLFGQSLGRGWWMQRVPLGATPHNIVYSAAARSCYVVVSTPQPFSMSKASFDVQLKISYDEDRRKSFTVEKPMALPPLSAATTGAPVPLNDQFEVRFFSCADWTCTDTYTLEGNEKVLSAQCIGIPRDTSMDAEPRSAMGPVCVLATAFPLGEDTTTRGRLILLGARHADGENKLRELHSEPLKGPATAVTGIEGSIAVAVGGTIRVFRYDYRTEKLETVAMLYAGAYVTSLKAFRNYLIFGDLFHSASLARFSAENHTLAVLGKDVNRFSIVHADMLYHGGTFGLVASDDDRNFAVLGYTPRVQEAAAAAPKPNDAANKNQPQRQQQQHQGKKAPKVLESILTVDGEYRFAGGSLLKLLRFRSVQGQGSPAVYVTNYGEVGFIVPLGEQTNLTSQFVARRLQKYVPPAAGLPSRMFLGFRQDDAKYSVRAREKLMHGPLLEDLFRLDTRQRKAVSADASTQLERVLNVGAIISTETALF